MLGEYLRSGYRAIYGPNGDPSTGYKDGVRAVEAAAIAVVCPNDKEAFLGKVIGQLKAVAKDAKRWKLALGTDISWIFSGSITLRSARHSR